MDSIIEQQRQNHEEIEHFERALYSILSRPANAHEQKLQNEHKASQILDRISSRVQGLHSLYQDEDARKQELELLSAPQNQSDLGEFYSRLAKLQEHHSKYPDSDPAGFELELAALVEEPVYEPGDEDYEEEDPISLLFSGEEAYGKYLDLYANHVAYTNIKNIGKRPGYLQYLDLLIPASGVVHQELSKEARLSKDYETYIKNLHTYLLSFTKKSQPLYDVDSEQREAELDFEKKWEAGEIEGWDARPSADANGESSNGIWCSACQKNYSKQTVFDAHLTSKKHIKATQKQSESTSAPPNPNGTSDMPPPVSTTKGRHHTAALNTYLAHSLLTNLTTILNDTKSNVERRFSLTAREREQELLDQQNPKPVVNNTSNANGGQEEEQEEEEERIYNPLKLPLGWDGKPIPYWLYKLHGLGVEYRCEICSDHVYMGRKNFDRHFQESRHAFGMRALGLPNTKHFHEITRIADAMALAEKLKQEGKNEVSASETMEELEDDEGNVYNRKTYEDLKRQGLV